MGRRRMCPDEVVERVAALHRQGLSYRRIGAAMEAAGIPTPSGRDRWYAETSHKLLQTYAGQAALARLTSRDG